MGTLLTRPQLAAKIKAKYPEYSDFDDYELVNKVVAKHPEYGDVLDPAEASVVNAADVVDLPPTMTTGGKFPPPPVPEDPLSGVMDGRGPRLTRRFTGNEPDWAKAGEELIKGGAENLGDRAMGQLKGVGQGASNLAKVLGFNVGAPQMNVDRPAEMAGAGESRAMVPALATGGLGVLGSGAIGGAAETGTMQGAAAGAATGGLLAGAGYLGSRALGMADKAFPLVSPFVKGAVLNSPLLGPMLKGGIKEAQLATRPIAKPLAQVRAEAEAVLEAEKIAKLESLHSINSGIKPGAAFPPPPGMGASGLPPVSPTPPTSPSSSTGFTPTPTSAPQVTFTAGKPAAKAPTAPAKPMTPPPTLDEAAPTTPKMTPQERAAKIREWKANGEDVGANLSRSHREASGRPDIPVDKSDITEAQSLIEKFGGKKFAKAHIERSKADLSDEEYKSMLSAIDQAKPYRGK